MNRIFEALIAAFGPMGPVWVMGGFGLILIFTALPILMFRRNDPLQKLEREREAMRLAAASRANATGARRRQDAAGLRADAAKPSRLATLAPLFQPKDQEKIKGAREKLMQAGYRSRTAVQAFFVARVLGAVLIGVGALAFALLRGTEVDVLSYSVIGGVAAGYALPSYWVTRRRAARQDEIGNGFPDALDMMLVCVEAGQSLDQALLRVSQEMEHAHPSLAEEFQIVSVEMRAGKERSQVLRDFGVRAGVPDISSFVTVLIQSSQFGTSIAEALRVYAAEMRDKRVMRAEEKANKLPTKLTLGTMFFTVPPLMIILIGPSLADIAKFLTQGK
ncbi:type II secretion system F family protein [Albimonas sp. CAU 1670]|uniref:type II secretion system F family protein n=1 Tax=Albimonas sp. CAU 1670 TaxID=3032599 RepID=UPI0023DB8A6C|nr:type II secretion system F family protein [Albimonas sp. CAU 1670]MDF2234427.1 type II secretion system F family protein [Albimonas sp. CAU 1670]